MSPRKRAPPSSQRSKRERRRAGCHRHRCLRRRSPESQLATAYEPIIVGRPALISFQTVAELRFGALRRNWGPARMRELEARIATAQVVYPGPDLVLDYAQLRVGCERVGHALSQRDHDADRWIAATALRLGLPLVSNDRIFEGVPGLETETIR